MRKEGLKDKSFTVRHKRAMYLSLVTAFVMVFAIFAVLCYTDESEAVPGSYEDPYTWTSANSVSLDGGTNFDKSLADVFDVPLGAYRTDEHPTITLKAGYYNTTVDRIIGGKHYTGSGLVIMHPLTINGATDGEGQPATVLYADFANSGSSGFSFWKDDGVSPNELIFTKTSSVSLNNLKLMPMVYFGHKYASDTSNVKYRLLDLSNSDPAWFTPNCTITSMSTADGDAKSVFTMDNIVVVKADTNLMHTPAINNDAEGTPWTGGNTMYMMEDGGNCQFFAGNVGGYGSYTDFDITISNFKSCGGLSFSKVYATETGSKKSSATLTNIDIDVPASNSTDRVHDGGDARGIKTSANTEFTNSNVVINILGRNSINTNDDLSRNVPSSVVNIKDDLELTADFTINDDVIFNVAEGKTLTVPNGITITNNGTINGNVTGVGNGTITGTGTVNNPATITTLPVASSLTYSGEPQALITEGVADAGVVKYSLSLEGPWTTDVPTGIAAGSYVVYYMVDVDTAEDPFHSDLPASAERAVNATIAQKAVTVTADNKSKTYGQDDPTLTATVDGTLGGDQVVYNLTRAAGENAGDYTITPSGDVSQGNYAVTYVPGTFTINKADAVLTQAPAAVAGLAYTGNAQNLVTAGTATGGTVQYSLTSGSGYSATIPAGTLVGVYTVYYKVVGDANHNDIAEAGPIEVSIAKATIAWPTIASKVYTGSAQTATVPADARYTVTANAGGTDVGSYSVTLTLTDAAFVNYKWTDVDTQAKTVADAFAITKATAVATVTGATGLVYSGEAQNLATGSTTFGTLLYSLTSGSGYSATVPTGTDAGAYKVYYKVEGTANFNGVDEACVDVTIAKAASSVTAPTAKELTYAGEAQELVNAGTSATGTVKYSLTLDGTFAVEIPKGTNVGSYTVFYMVEGDANHNDIAPSASNVVAVTIAKFTPIVTIINKDDGVCSATNNNIGDASVQLVGGEVYSGTITYTYYTDANCTSDATTTAPSKVGTYYVKATIVASDNYNAAASNVATLLVKHVLTPVAKSGNVAAHYDCSECHKHFLDEAGTVEYTLPDPEQEQTVVNTEAAVDETDSSKATADATATIAAVEAVIAADPEAQIVAEISTESENVTTVAVEAAQVKQLADKGADVKVSNTTSSAEFKSEALKEMTLTSGDFEFQAKTTEVPEKYKEQLGNDAVAVDLKLNVGGTAVTQFGEKVKVTVAYTLPEGADASKLKVYYVGGDVLEEFDCVYDANAKTVTFETPHFSEFAVGFGSGSSSGENNQGLLLAVLLVAAIVAPIIAALIIFRKE